MHRAGILLLLALATACPHAAVAAETASCKLTMVNTVSITLEGNDTRVFVPVIINGTKETFLLDTGGADPDIRGHGERPEPRDR